jgi:intracellular septation protein
LEPQGIMKALFDFLPIVLFFGAYKLYGILVATAVAMAATVLLAGWGWWRKGRPEVMHLISAALILVFGGATLVLADERFIKIKPTVLYGLLAVVFLGSGLTGRTVTERMYRTLGDGIPTALLRRMNWWWVAFFTLLAGLNLYVANHYPTDAWVNFKLFGLLGLTGVFVLVQAFVLARAMPTDPPRERDG